QRTVIGAIRCGETFESRMPLGRVSITSEQMAAPGGWAMGHLFFIAARLSHDEKRKSLRRNAETGGLRAREIGCWGRSARAARGILSVDKQRTSGAEPMPRDLIPEATGSWPARPGR